MRKVTEEGLSDQAGGIRLVNKKTHMRVEKDVFINADADMHMCGLKPVYVLPASSITSSTTSFSTERQLPVQGRLTTAQ